MLIFLPILSFLQFPLPPRWFPCSFFHFSFLLCSPLASPFHLSSPDNIFPEFPPKLTWNIQWTLLITNSMKSVKSFVLSKLYDTRITNTIKCPSRLEKLLCCLILDFVLYLYILFIQSWLAQNTTKYTNQRGKITTKLITMIKYNKIAYRKNIKSVLFATRVHCSCNTIKHHIPSSIIPHDFTNDFSLPEDNMLNVLCPSTLRMKQSFKGKAGHQKLYNMFLKAE